MKVGVYNRHWPTLGGGERYGGGIAEVLAADHDVELVAHEPLDLADFGERLRLNLQGVGLRVISITDALAVVRASAQYDLFVNVAYMSHDPSEADRSIYVVHFPTPPNPLHWRKRAAIRLLRPLVTRNPHAPSGWGRGFFAWERGRLGQKRAWTAGAAEMYVDVPSGESAPLEILFGRDMPVALGPWRAEIEVDGEPRAEVTIVPSRSPLARPVTATVPIRRRGDGEPSRVVIRSETWSPSELLGVDDSRLLGVRLAGVRFDRGIGAFLGSRYPILLRQPEGGAFLASYDRVLSNSHFTQRYVREWWGRDSEVLYPPVRMHAPGQKRPMILSVGRFFAAHGHSKKQAEMVGAFRSLHDRGLTDWELHLVGGCSTLDWPYLDHVKRLARGIPVIFHIGATGNEVNHLFGQASIFWSATGLGEDYKRDPIKFEHFGITTVEAMSAGAVPVVLARGGQPEIVRNGIDGLHFTDVDGLIDATERLVRNPALRQRLSSTAANRAHRFGMKNFAQELGDIVGDVIGAGRAAN